MKCWVHGQHLAGGLPWDRALHMQQHCLLCWEAPCQCMLALA